MSLSPDSSGMAANPVSPALAAAIADLYAELDRRIAAHTPVCRNRGACCRFGAFGHRLMVTPLELDYFHKHHHDAPRTLADTPASGLAVLPASEGAACPFQVDGRCTTRHARPIGCRVFFCESEQDGWQAPLTEWALSELRRLHDDHGIDYRYQEWLEGLQALDQRIPDGRR